MRDRAALGSAIEIGLSLQPRGGPRACALASGPRATAKMWHPCCCCKHSFQFYMFWGSFFVCLFLFFTFLVGPPGPVSWHLPTRAPLGRRASDRLCCGCAAGVDLAKVQMMSGWPAGQEGSFFFPSLACCPLSYQILKLLPFLSHRDGLDSSLLAGLSKAMKRNSEIHYPCAHFGCVARH